MPPYRTIPSNEEPDSLFSLQQITETIKLKLILITNNFFSLIFSFIVHISNRQKLGD